MFETGISQIVMRLTKCQLTAEPATEFHIMNIQRSGLFKSTCDRMNI